MKTLKLYTPVIIQALLLLIGFIMVNAISANEATPHTKLVSTVLIEDIESEPIVENWMMELDSWENTTSSYSSKNSLNSNNIEKEDEMILEDWMINTNNAFWSNRTIDQIDLEENIELEEWMTNAALWNNSN